jgi:hypothetical protein
VAWPRGHLVFAPNPFSEVVTRSFRLSSWSVELISARLQWQNPDWWFLSVLAPFGSVVFRPCFWSIDRNRKSDVFVEFVCFWGSRVFVFFNRLAPQEKRVYFCFMSRGNCRLPLIAAYWRFLLPAKQTTRLQWGVLVSASFGREKRYCQALVSSLDLELQTWPSYLTLFSLTFLTLKKHCLYNFTVMKVTSMFHLWGSRNRYN